MYVVKVEDFLRMAKLEPHQVLRSKGYAAVFDEVSTAAFVSHQWCGRSSADPSFRQLSILQKVFERAGEATLVVEADLFRSLTFRKSASVRRKHLLGVRSWVMWYDYFSVPQHEGVTWTESSQQMDVAGAAESMKQRNELARAVASLSSYVDACEVFLVLAPTIEHEDGSMLDYMSWVARGWCRFERMARQLSDRKGPMLLMRRPDTVFEIGAQDYLIYPVGQGDFSVEADRQGLGPIVQRLLSAKLRRLLDGEEFEECRHLLSWCRGILSGLTVAWQDAVPPELLADVDGPGPASLRWPGIVRIWGPRPLLLAASVGDTVSLQAILDSRADISMKQRGDVLSYFITNGQQAIHDAALQGHVQVIAMLLDRRAGVQDLDGRGQTPIFQAATSGACAATKLLLHHRAAINHRGATEGQALQIAAVFGKPGIVSLLIASGAACASNVHGISPLHGGAAFRCGPEALRSIIAARGCVDSRLAPLLGSLPWIRLSLLSLVYRLGRGGFVGRLGYNSWGATPLMNAAMFDNYQAARELISARADVHIENSRGLTFARIATEFGTWDLAMSRVLKDASPVV